MIKRLRHYWINRTTRRRFLLGTAGGGLGAMGGGYAYMRLWESGWLETTRHKVPLKQQGAQFRVLHLSDLHASRVVSLAYLRRALGVGLEMKPDLICITGDFITWKYKQYDAYTRVLRVLSDYAPVYACLGNHDGGSWAQGKMKIGTSSSQPVRDLLASANIRLLHNEHTTETINGQKINLVGVGDLWNNECKPKAAFLKLDGTHPTLLLSHNPDTKDLMQGHPWDLMLCGHTHGGQVFLPGLGAPLAPVKDKRYVRGLHRLGDRWLHISKGVGNLHGVRLNCRPEVSLLNIT